MSEFNFDLEIKAALDLLNERNWEEAEKRAKNALVVNKKDERGYRHAATAAINLGADDRAHKYLVLGTNRCPNSTPLAKALEQLNQRRSAHKQDLADVVNNSFDPKPAQTIAPNEKKRETPGIVLRHNSHQSMFALLQEGSEALNLQHYMTAIECYRKALEAARNSPVEERPERARKYALSLARVGLGTYDSLCTAIDTLLELKGKTFPAAFYGLALAFEKLNRFKSGLDVTQEGLKLVLDIDLDWETYCWPGQNRPIEETRRSVLKVKLTDLASKFRLPPKPNAVCRLPECLQLSSHIMPCTNIYHTDPDFVGYVVAECEEKCRIMYHAPCWKHFKETVANLAKVSDKDMLGRQCPTEGCRTGFYKPRHSIIIKITVIGSDNKVKAEVEGERSEDPVPPPAPVPASPAKKQRKRPGEKTSNAGVTKKAAQKVQQACQASGVSQYKKSTSSQAQLQILSCDYQADSDQEPVVPDIEFDSDDDDEDRDVSEDYYFLEEKDGEEEEYEAKFIELLMDAAAWAWKDERETFNFKLRKEDICDPRLIYFGNENFQKLKSYLIEPEEKEEPKKKEQKSKLRKFYHEYLQKHGPTSRSLIIKQIKDMGHCKNGEYFLQDEMGVCNFLLECPLFAAIDDKLCIAENIDQLYSSIEGPIAKFFSPFLDTESEGDIFEDIDYDDEPDYPEEEEEEEQIVEPAISYEDELNAEMMKMTVAEEQYLNAQKKVINNHDISVASNSDTKKNFEATPSTSSSYSIAAGTKPVVKKDDVDLILKINDKVDEEKNDLSPKVEETNTILNEENLKFINPFPENDPTFDVEGGDSNLEENEWSSVKNDEKTEDDSTSDVNKKTEVVDDQKRGVQHNSQDTLFESDSDTNETDEDTKSPEDTDVKKEEEVKVVETAEEVSDKKVTDQRLCPTAKTFLCPSIEPFKPTGPATPPPMDTANYPLWSTADMGASTAAASEPSVPSWSGETLEDGAVDTAHLMEMLKKAEHARRIADEQVAGLKLKELNLKMELEDRERQLSDEKDANRNLARRLEEQAQRHRKAQEALQASATAEAATRERQHLEQREKALSNVKAQKLLVDQLKEENVVLKAALEKSNTQLAPTKSQLLASQKRMLQLLESHWADITRHYNDTAVRNVAQMYTAVRHLNEDSTPSTRNMYQSIEQWEDMIAKIAETSEKFKKILEVHDKQIKAGKPADKKLNALIIPALPKMPDYPIATIIDKDLQTVGCLFGGKNKSLCSVATQTKMRAVEPPAGPNQAAGFSQNRAAAEPPAGFNSPSSQYVPPSLSTLAAAAGPSSTTPRYSSSSPVHSAAPRVTETYTSRMHLAAASHAHQSYTQSPSLMNLLKPKPTPPVETQNFFPSAPLPVQAPKPAPIPVVSKPVPKPSKVKFPPTMADALKGAQVPNVPQSKPIPRLKAKSSSGKKSNYQVLIDDLVEANYHVSETQVCDALTVVRERNNNKLTGLSKEDIYRRVSEVLVEFLLEKSPAELKPVPEGLLEGAYDNEDDDICCICMEEQNKVQDEIFLLPCKHSFHSPCIHSWLKQEPYCPMCRQIVKQVYANTSTDFPPLRH